MGGGVFLAQGIVLSQANAVNNPGINELHIGKLASIIAHRTKAPELAEALENVLSDYDERERIYPGSESKGHPAKVKVMESARTIIISLKEEVHA